MVDPRNINFALEDTYKLFQVLNEYPEEYRRAVEAEIQNQMKSILEHFITCTWGAHYNTLFETTIQPYLKQSKILHEVLLSDVIKDKNAINGKTGARIYPELLEYLRQVRSKEIWDYLNQEFYSIPKLH